MDITIHNSKKKVSVSDAAFDASFNEALVHQLVVSYMSAARSGTKAQKTVPLLVAVVQSPGVKKELAELELVRFEAQSGARVVSLLQLLHGTIQRN